jgi:hypothetical protein
MPVTTIAVMLLCGMLLSAGIVGWKLYNSWEFENFRRYRRRVKRGQRGR